MFGLLGAFLVINRRTGAGTRMAVLVFLGINLAFGFSGAGIDWRAHLGGACSPACSARRRWSTPPRRAGPWCRPPAWAAVLILVLAGVAWRTAQLT